MARKRLEAVNTWEHVSQDLPRDFRTIERTHGKNAAARALAGVLVKTLLGAFLLNRLDEELYGGTPAPFDVLGLSANFIASGNGLTTNRYLKTILDNGWERLTGKRLFDTDGDTLEGDFDWGAAIEDTGYNLSNEIPYLSNASGLLGLGDQSLPMPDLQGAVKGMKSAVTEDGLFSAEVARQLGGRKVARAVVAGADGNDARQLLITLEPEGPSLCLTAQRPVPALACRRAPRARRRSCGAGGTREMGTTPGSSTLWTGTSGAWSGRPCSATPPWRKPGTSTRETTPPSA